jgi:FAD-linked sulfhydryl oxidase
MAGPGASRRYLITLLTASILVGYCFVTFFRGLPNGTRALNHGMPNTPNAPVLQNLPGVSTSSTDDLEKGPSIMPALGNETAKAELGRATWKYFHTVMARFPDKPTPEESSTLKTYIHLFQRLYPCGECSEHFRKILEKFPPQTSSRSAAAVWACHVHNEVNKSLGKEVWDCSKIGDFYDCGCAEDGTEGKGEEKKKGESEEKKEISKERMEKISGTNGRDFDMDLLKAGNV